MKTISNRRFYRNGLAAWLLFMIFALLEGIVRAGLAHSANEKVLLLLGGLAMTAFIYLVTWLMLKHYGAPAASGPLLGLGAWWAFLTLGFEATLFVGLFDMAPGDFLAAYHPREILEGNTILIGLALMFLAPWLCRKFLIK